MFARTGAHKILAHLNQLQVYVEEHQGAAVLGCDKVWLHMCSCMVFLACYIIVQCVARLAMHAQQS